MDISIVIGANYGDEGKGVITDSLAAKRPDSIVVMTNGGSQRGHTVISGDSVRHVFKHFGSGTFRGCGTYFPETFILNPMQFVKEYYELVDDCNVHNVFTARHPDCMFSTPFDMIMNQDIESWRRRNGKAQGTCGMGIWETLVRYNTPAYSFWRTIDDFNKAPHDSKVRYLWSIVKEYLPIRYKQVTGEQWLQPSYVNDFFIEHFISDVAIMCDLCRCDTEDYKFLSESNRSLIFENGQGLLLDEEYWGKEYSKYATPSHTGMRPVLGILTKADIVCEKVDAYYVSRPYITRHGPGYIKNNYSSGDVVSNIDKTNVDNELQGDFRKVALDYEGQRRTINQDLSSYMRKLRANGKKAHIAFTHIDEMSPKRILFTDVVGCGTEDGTNVEGLGW